MFCICCEKNIIKSSDYSDNETDIIFKSEIRERGGSKFTVDASSEMWENGLVDKISAGYGSSLDGNMYMIGVCDNCIKDKESKGIIAFVGDYMSPKNEYIKEKINKSKIKIRRNLNLDKLTNGEI